ncbi:hypothetical protein FSARC_14014 [Fusarium sarcochroum]|uniref:Uncharacterized protein n=1 Tax=Fusarium sarcochroum TaxID=1208366 RepID=A0A8H4WRH0_9HYPO|nr:hypothetical protein FSARC_14014 [Fusarium sarcochroum]
MSSKVCFASLTLSQHEALTFPNWVHQHSDYIHTAYIKPPRSQRQEVNILKSYKAYGFPSSVLINKYWKPTMGEKPRATVASSTPVNPGIPIFQQSNNDLGDDVVNVIAFYGARDAAAQEEALQAARVREPHDADVEEESDSEDEAWDPLILAPEDKFYLTATRIPPTDDWAQGDEDQRLPAAKTICEYKVNTREDRLVEYRNTGNVGSRQITITWVARRSRAPLRASMISLSLLPPRVFILEVSRPLTPLKSFSDRLAIPLLAEELKAYLDIYSIDRMLLVALRG